jgi:integrase
MTKRRRRSGFGSVVSKGTATHPSFAIRWFEGTRRKQQGGFTSRTAAAEALARVRVGLGDGTLVEKRRASISFDVVARQWLDLHSAPNLRSHRHNLFRYEKHVAPFFAGAPLSAVTARRILELRQKLQADVAAATVNRVLALLRTILNFAVAAGHLGTSPIARLGRGRLMLAVERGKLAPPIEKASDVGRLLTAVADIERETGRRGLHALFATLVYTGCRRGEALGLRWADVDLERRILTVRRSYAGLTKSGKHRTVPIAPPLADILKAHRAAASGELVFPDASGKMHSPNAKLEDVLFSALERIGHPRIRVHDLRHVFASHFVMSGGDIFTLQRILGHSSPQLTSDTYAHLSSGHMASAADRVSFAPAEPVKP